MKGRFNWGHGIALVLTAYVGLMIYMGKCAMSIETDLVREDYYQAELAHGDRMEAEALGQAFGTPRVSYDAGKLIISGQASDLDALLAGGAELYVPTNSRKDRTWQWAELQGERMSPERYEVEFDAPNGLAYITFKWLTGRGPAEKRIPVHFPA